MNPLINIARVHTKKIVAALLFAVAVFLLGGSSINITGKQSGPLPQEQETGKASSQSAGRVPAANPGLDQAANLFISSKQKMSSEGKAMIRYVNTANDAIPLTTEALRFALVEAILGAYDPVNDAIKRLEEGALALQALQPPTEALAFHQMSISLLREYEKILSVVISIPRQDFEPEKLEDDFERLNILWGIANTELRAIKQRHGIPLFPKAITFYGEVIGAGQQ